MVIVTPERGKIDIGSNVDIPEKPEAGIGRRLFEYPGDLLDLLMIGRYPEPHQAERHGQPLVHVDVDAGTQLLEQVFGHVKGRLV